MAEPNVAPPALVLYTSTDEAFVRGYFLPALGDAPGAQGIDARDVTATAAVELERAVTACGLIIAVISPAFLAAPWSRLSELLASGAAVERDLALIPLVLEAGPLPLHLRERVGLDFRFRAEWDQQAQRLRDHLARPAPVEAPLPCPYPGMRPFEAAEARTFYGRGAEIDALVGLVSAGEREVYLVGPSGSGKSSLIAAGVMPRMAAQPGAPELVLRAMRPGDAPVRRIAECLDAGSPDAAAVAAWAARHPGARLVMFIDQLEELFTLASPAEQAGFAAALRTLRDEPRCVVLLAVRADFYAELMQSPLWLDGPRRHVDLPALRGAALRAAIERPARTLDVYLERDLVERLLADVADASAVLPLLQETLVQLWSRRRRRRLLTVVEYDALGEGGRSGLAVAISSRADRCLGELTPSQVVIARRLLLRLVSFGEGRPNTRRRQTRGQLAAGEAPAAFDGVLRHLVAARLVAMDGDRSDDDLVDLCHDVLITAWPSFAAWVEARRADELRRRQIQASASEWIARGRGASGLLDAGELAIAIAWRDTDAARELGESPEVAALISASRAALARARRRRRGLLGGAFGGLAAVTVVIALLAVSARDQARAASREADRARREADHARLLLARSYEEEGRRLFIEDRPQEAVPYLLEARRLGLDEVILRVLFHAAERRLPLIPALEHHGQVNSAAFSPDGTRVVTASFDQTARVWNAATGTPVTGPLVHQGPVNSAAFSPDGTRVVTASSDGTVRIWDAATGQPVTRPLEHRYPVSRAAFSPDGTRVVTADTDATAQIWDAATGELVTGPLEHQGGVMRAAFSPDGRRVVTASLDGTARVWDAATGAPITRPLEHEEKVMSAAFSADGTRVVTASDDTTARVWDAVTGKPITPPLEHDNDVRSAAFSPDGTRVVTASNDTTARVWDAVTGKPITGPLRHRRAVVHAAFSPDGTRVVTASDDTTARLWDAVTGKPLIAPLQHQDLVVSVAFSPDGTRLVTASDDAVWVWDLASKLPLELPAEVQSAALSPDGTYVVTWGDDRTARVWDAMTGTPVIAPLQHQSRVQSAAFSPDGSRIVTASADRTARVWDTVTGKPITGPLQHPYEIRGAAFSPDGTRVLTASPDGARVWDATTSSLVTSLLQFQGILAGAEFSADGARVFTIDMNRFAREIAQVWDVATGKPVTRPLPLRDAGWSASFSPDGARVVTIGEHGTAQVRDAATGLPVGVPLEHQRTVRRAAFSPDGTRVVTTSDDDKARVWDAATGRPVTSSLEHGDRVTSAEFSRDGTRVLTASADGARLWDATTGKLLLLLEHRHPVKSATFSRDGTRVLTVCDRGKAQVWDVGPDEGTLAQWSVIARRSPLSLSGVVLTRRSLPSAKPAPEH